MIVIYDIAGTQFICTLAFKLLNPNLHIRQ